jgi:ABC-2 type transport system ATP-binding protein
MRGLLRDYAERGGTVCLSSHLLHEVEKIADELILIGHGRIVASGTKQELLHTRGAFVRAVEHEALLDALQREGISALPSGSGLRSDAEAIQIGKVAAAHNITLVELRPAEGEGLEELFLQLTADTQREGVVA